MGGAPDFENDALAPEEPNVYRLRSPPLFGAPAERNVLWLMSTSNYTFRSAGAKKKLTDSTVYKHSVPPGLSDLFRNKKMTKYILIILLLVGSLLWSGGPAVAAPPSEVVKISITNPTDDLRLHENVVVSVAELKRIAPDFKAGDVIVTTSDAATLEEDKRTLQTIELPSQADDLDGDNKYDELAFQIELKQANAHRHDRLWRNGHHAALA